MKKKHDLFRRYKIQIIIILVCFLIILASRLYLENLLGNDWTSFLINIATAITAGIVVGIYYDLSIRSELMDEVIGKIKLKDEVIRSGIVSYYGSFTDIDLRKYFEESKKVKIYVHYGHTLFNQIGDTIEKFLQIKKNELIIYVMHEDNKFLSGLGAHWGYNDDGSNETQLKSKIQDSLRILQHTINDLKSKNKLKAKVSIYKLKRHPVFYSFYIFDNKIIFVPSKLVQNKNFKPIAFVAQDGDYPLDIYKKCLMEIEDIHHSNDALEEVINFNKNN